MTRALAREMSSIVLACILASAAMLLTACHSVNLGVTEQPQSPTGTSLHAWDDDVARKASLERDGICRVADDVVAWFPRSATSGSQAMPAEEMDAIVARLEHGIRAAKAYIHAPDWSFQGDRRIYSYFPDANFISHAPGGNTAFIPLWRIRGEQAPWLHEAMHLLMKVDGDWLHQPEGVAEARMPLWMHEGMAEAIAIEVAAQNHLVHYSPLISVPAAELDDLAADRIRACPDPQRLLAFVGGRGKLPELFGEDRMAYAPAFYAASTSFVRYLAHCDGGYHHLLIGIRSFDRECEEYERRSGRSLMNAKLEWLRQVGLEEDTRLDDRPR